MDQEDIQLMDPNPCKKVEFNAHAPELEICSSDRADTADEIFRFQKRNEKSSHLTDIECNGTSAEAGSDGVAMADLQLTKTKDHECPICFKVFSTGQALGGHKRAHYAGFSESRIKEMTAANQELRDIQNVFDLNLPVITSSRGQR
nr:zinc finger protein ZAT4-like [Coffea arabica]